MITDKINVLLSFLANFDEKPLMKIIIVSVPITESFFVLVLYSYVKSLYII